MRVLPTLALLATITAASAPAQESPKQFDVVSIRENRTPGKSSSNFPLDPTARYNYQGNLLSAHNVPLLQLLVFAYAKSMYQIIDLRRQVPSWARDTSFDIQARSDEPATKDEMRAMMRAALEDRFHLKMHTESRETTVLRLELAHPGKLGPNLRIYADTEAPCDKVPPYGDVAAATTPDGYPAYCGVMVWLPGTPAGETRVGGRHLKPDDLALGIGAAADFTGRPVVDATGLNGFYDMLLNYTPDNPDPSHTSEPSTGVPLNEALHNQLGLKLEPGKARVEVYVLDHVEKPSEN
jgi:uncharacterized protein (TIGR03435 family)